MKIIITIIAAICFLTPLSLYAATATETMQVTVDEVLRVMKDPAMRGNQHTEAKKERIWDIINNVFDYKRLAQQALGRNWKKIDKKEQDEFTQLFSHLLGKSYIKRILMYGDEKIVIDKEVPLSQDIAEVQTKLLSKSNQIPISYRLNYAKGQWKVFDVIIEGASLTKNYRSQFKNYLTKKNMSQLLVMLGDKLNKQKKQ